MIQRLLLLFAVVLAIAPAAAAPAGPALWVVHGSGGSEITLFGTVHALPRDDPWFGPAIKARLDGADTLVLETIIPADRMALAPLLGEIGTAPGLKPLSARVSRTAAPALAAAAARAGMPLAALDRMKTWLAAITLSEANFATLGIDPESGVEPALEARARAAGKAVIGLETPEQQLRYFDALPEADQVKLLEATLDEIGTARADIDKLIALWRAGDVETIAREFATEARASPLLARVLITDRNTRWANWIAGVAKHPGKVFIAVGAGHFGGADGLLTLLKARGLVAERVDVAALAADQGVDGAVAVAPARSAAARR